MTGVDVTAHKRAVYRDNNASYSWKKLTHSNWLSRRTYGPAFDKLVNDSRHRYGLKPDRGIDNELYQELRAHNQYLAYEDSLLKEYAAAHPKLTAQDVGFQRLLASMQTMDKETTGYLLGGGHGVPLKTLDPHQRLDCSSSTSKALYDAGMFPDEVAWVSGKIATDWGQPGKGETFTVYANTEHVWVRLHRSRWWRFDTSPHGDGGRGPKLRMLPRFTSRFVARHFPGQ